MKTIYELGFAFVVAILAFSIYLVIPKLVLTPVGSVINVDVAYGMIFILVLTSAAIVVKSIIWPMTDISKGKRL